MFAGWTAREWLSALLLSLANLATVLTLITLLWSFGNPILNFSWLNLLAMNAQERQSGTNLVASATQIPWFGIAFAILLAINIPRLARREEEIFRLGTMSLPDLAQRSVRFGLIHMIVGVPLCAAIGLMISGVFFTWHYMRGGVREATFVHALNNYWVLGLIAGMAVLRS